MPLTFRPAVAAMQQRSLLSPSYVYIPVAMVATEQQRVGRQRAELGGALEATEAAGRRSNDRGGRCRADGNHQRPPLTTC
jgi:hypothetical protein